MKMYEKDGSFTSQQSIEGIVTRYYLLLEG